MDEGSTTQVSEDTIGSSLSLDHTETNQGCLYDCCNPRGTFHRFVALIFMCFLGFGPYFCGDNPGALEDHIKHDLNVTTAQYSLFYSMYSWPNIVFCFVGGFLIDRVFGIRLGTNIYMGLTLLGQILFATGVILDAFGTAVLGRFVFGIGAESLAVAQSKYAVLWFKGKELNTVFGLQLGFARVGSTVNFLVMESVYNWANQDNGVKGLGIAIFIATTTCLFSMVSAVILGFIDKRAERVLRPGDATSTEVARLSDIGQFRYNFWLITTTSVTYCLAIYTFIGLGKDFFKSKFHMSDQQANGINSLIYLISGIGSPILGLFIDKIGKNLSWSLIAIMLTIGAHSMLAFTSINPYIGVLLLGLAFGCGTTSLWPLVAIITPEYQLGTAYGVLAALQNFGLAVFTMLAGKIVDKYGYVCLEILFIATLVVSLISAIILWTIDFIQNGGLNMAPEARSRLLSTKEDDKETLFDSEATTSIVG